MQTQSITHLNDRWQIKQASKIIQNNSAYLDSINLWIDLINYHVNDWNWLERIEIITKSNDVKKQFTLFVRVCVCGRGSHEFLHGDNFLRVCIVFCFFVFWRNFHWTHTRHTTTTASMYLFRFHSHPIPMRYISDTFSRHPFKTKRIHSYKFSLRNSDWPKTSVNSIQFEVIVSIYIRFLLIYSFVFFPLLSAAIRLLSMNT